jgi:hypothetical protein
MVAVTVAGTVAVTMAAKPASKWASKPWWSHQRGDSSNFFGSQGTPLKESHGSNEDTIQASLCPRAFLP